MRGRSARGHEAIEYTYASPVRATDASLGVSEDRIVLTTNEWFSIRAKNGNLLSTVGRDMTYPLPFTRADPASYLLGDPRAAYDPVSGRLWIVMGEAKIVYDEVEETYDWTGHIHLAVSKNSSPDDFSSTHWHYYTGSNAYSLQSDDFGATKFIGWSDQPRLAFDANNIYISATDGESGPPEVLRFAVIIIPRTHEGGSILAGNRPDETDITIIQAADPTHVDPIDTSYHHHPVWETTGDDAPGAQFFIATELSPISGGILQQKLRLAGVYFDSGSETWQYQHKTLDLVTMSSDDRFYNHDHDPATPHATWRPGVGSTAFESAVLWTDPNGEVVRLFATHSVRTSGTSGSAQTVRWYVIDPDLSNFPGEYWDPEVLTVGDIAFAGAEEAYHPSIAVNPIGQALITFTMSSPDGTDWPALWRAWLSSDFASVASKSRTLAGPEFRLTFGFTWADFAGLQADPSGCGFWSHETLVHDPGGGATESSTRQTWLIYYDFSCGGNGDFNGDSAIDAYDLFDFVQAYDARDPSADLDASDTITPVDTVIFMDAWYRGIE